jgi:aminoglycoside phosphotransferase (APT) family kinase protein
LPSVPVWAPEVEVDEPLVRRLLDEQLGLRPRSLRLHASGWDNSVWVVDETWAFRFPRREVAIPGVEREIAVLPAIAALLPVPIPVPEHVGRPANGYPWPFFGCRFIEGQEVAAAALDEAARLALASRSRASCARCTPRRPVPRQAARPSFPSIRTSAPTCRTAWR